jgi:hypothetical protein
MQQARSWRARDKRKRVDQRRKRRRRNELKSAKRKQRGTWTTLVTPSHAHTPTHQ